MLHLRLQIGQHSLLLILFFLVHLFNYVNGLFGAKVRLFVFNIFVTLSAASFLILGDLSENIFLILLVRLQLELPLRSDQVLFFLDVVEELVALTVPFACQFHQVVFEAVVGGLAGAAHVVINFLALVLGMLVNCVRALGVHETGVAGMVSI